MSGLLFWSCVAVVVYTYVGYPILLFLRAALRPSPIAASPVEPTASLIICAFDEAAAIGPRLENALELDYPEGKLEIIVASDGSTDGTQAVVSRYEERGVRLLDLPRNGKIPTLNAAVAEATGEILVFSDANSQFDRDALRQLMMPFADAGVGGVAGDQRYRRRKQRETDGTDGERAYWNLDRALKQAQSRAGNVISSTGAIHAVRRALFTRVPSGVTDDFWISTAVIAAGRRLVFAPLAIAREDVATSSDAEFRRKVRVMTRGLHGVWLRRELLDPRHSGFYAVQLLSHKVLRRLVAIPMIVGLLATPALWSQGLFYQAALGGGLLLCVAGLLGTILPARYARARVFSIPHYFAMVNLAALVAWSNLLRGRRIDSWVPERADAPPLAEDAPVSSS